MRELYGRPGERRILVLFPEQRKRASDGWCSYGTDGRHWPSTNSYCSRQKITRMRFRIRVICFSFDQRDTACRAPPDIYLCLTAMSSDLPVPWQVAHASPLPAVAMLAAKMLRFTMIMPPLVAIWLAADTES